MAARSDVRQRGCIEVSPTLNHIQARHSFQVRSERHPQEALLLGIILASGPFGDIQDDRRWGAIQLGPQVEALRPGQFEPQAVRSIRVLQRQPVDCQPLQLARGQSPVLTQYPQTSFPSG